MTTGNERGDVAQGEPLLEVRGVEKTYLRGPEEVHALAGVSLELRTGEVAALVGPSGSGKTTLLNILCGWEEPDRGELVWLRGDVPRGAAPPWTQLAIVPQTHGLLEDLSVQENVELPLRLGGRLKTSSGHLVTSLLERFGLDGYADRQPFELSLGEQQRLAMARAMVVKPSLLLADEPTGHQDAGWAQVVYESLKEAASEGTCCFVATHSGEFLKYADRVLSMRDGKLIRPEVESDLDLRPRTLSPPRP